MLVVAQTRSGGTGALRDAVLAGVEQARREVEGADVEVRSLHAFDAGPDDVLWADAIVLATPEHFGSMSGALKDFFERVFYPCVDHTKGRPYAIVVKGGHDGQGTVLSIRRIVAGLEWREVVEPVVAVGDVTEAHLAAATELGATVAAGLVAGLW